MSPVIDPNRELSVEELRRLIAGEAAAEPVFLKEEAAGVSPEQIRIARLEARMTQAQAGAVIRVPGRTWTNWELGRNRMAEHLFEDFLSKTATIRHALPPIPTAAEVRAARAHAGLTLKEAGAVIGVSFGQWGHYEKGRAKMNPDAYEAFLEATVRAKPKVLS